MNPSFAYPNCPTCSRPAERMTIEHNALTGSYLIAVTCHGKNRLLRITEDDLVGFQHGPLVLLKMEQPPALAMPLLDPDRLKELERVESPV